LLKNLKIYLDIDLKNNFVGSSKQLSRTIELIVRILKYFGALLIMFKIPAKYILMAQQNYFQIYLAKFVDISTLSMKDKILLYNILG